MPSRGLQMLMTLDSLDRQEQEQARQIERQQQAIAAHAATQYTSYMKQLEWQFAQTGNINYFKRYRALFDNIQKPEFQEAIWSKLSPQDAVTLNPQIFDPALVFGGSSEREVQAARFQNMEMRAMEQEKLAAGRDSRQRTRLALEAKDPKIQDELTSIETTAAMRSGIAQAKGQMAGALALQDPELQAAISGAQREVKRSLASYAWDRSSHVVMEDTKLGYNRVVDKQVFDMISSVEPGRYRSRDYGSMEDAGEITRLRDVADKANAPMLEYQKHETALSTAMARIATPIKDDRGTGLLPSDVIEALKKRGLSFDSDPETTINKAWDAWMKVGKTEDRLAERERFQDFTYLMAQDDTKFDGKTKAAVVKLWNQALHEFNKPQMSIAARQSLGETDAVESDGEKRQFYSTPLFPAMLNALVQNYKIQRTGQKAKASMSEKNAFIEGLLMNTPEFGDMFPTVFPPRSTK